MNRRQKIIVSITGIFLVLLILVGLTYAYFLTRIQGNSNAKSISAATANLSLEYKDGDGSIIDNDNITPGMEVGEKTFSVYNSGDGEVEYAVILDNVKITDKTGETETRLASNDFVYTLTCSSSCNGQDEETILPLIDNGLLVTNKIASKATQTYTITVKYKDTGVDQSADMGKKVEARVNIEDIKKINPYYNDKQTLAYNIINNAVTTKNGTEFKAVPLTVPLQQISLPEESELSVTIDDYGTSYYYRGMPEDNYVNFASMCWRIVRIQGDGTVKLVLAAERECNEEGSLTEKSGFATDGAKGTVGITKGVRYGSKTVNGYIVNDYIDGEGDYYGAAKEKLNEWLENKIGEKDPNYDKLKEENWCIGDLKTAYDKGDYMSDPSGQIIGTVAEKLSSGESFIYRVGNRYSVLKTPKLKCETTGEKGEIDKDKIGMLTMDEVAFAGGGASRNTNYYLNKNAKNYQWWTLSPYGLDAYGFGDGFATAIIVQSSGDLNVTIVGGGDDANFRPSVVLESGSRISSGNGTLENPYVIAS